MQSLIKTKQRKKRVDIPQLQKLDKLADKIRTAFENTNGLVKSAREKSREAVAEAILCGNYLNEAKEIVGHGGWLTWLAKHCKGIDADTARKWMRLSDQCHTIDLKDCASLRQAYIAVGILNDSDPERRQPPEPPRVMVAPQPIALPAPSHTYESAKVDTARPNHTNPEPVLEAEPIPETPETEIDPEREWAMGAVQRLRSYSNRPWFAEVVRPLL